MKRKLGIALSLTAMLFIAAPALAASAKGNTTVAYNKQCEGASAYLEEGNNLLQNAPGKAEAMYREALKKCPESVNAKFNLAVSIYRQGNAQKAVAELNALTTENPGHADAFRFLAYILVNDRLDIAKGKAIADKLVEMNPGDEGAKKIAMQAFMASIPESSGSQPAKKTIVKASADAGQASEIDTDIPRTKAKNPDAIAIIIGNRDYDSKDVPSVEYAINDAESVKKYLVNVLGYKEGNIIMLTNASKGKFEATFGTASDHRGRLYNYVKKGKSDIFVYYAGHGAPDPTTKQGYFVPSDADTNNIRLSGYPLKLLYENIAKTAKEMNTPNVFIVVDSCFSGGTARGELLLKNVSPIGIVVENPLLTMKNAVVMTSSSGSEVSSWYPEQGHSMFTYFFLKALKESAESGLSKLTAGEIFRKIADETEGLPYYARRLHERVQTPQIMGDENRALIK